MQYDSRLFRLFVAVTAAGLAFVLRMAAEALGGHPSPWLIFLLGVVFSAWYGGFKPGLVTAALLLLAGLWIESPHLSEAPVTYDALLFTLAALCICAAMQRLRSEHFRAQHTGARLHDVLESTQDAILSLDVEFRCLYANARAGQLAKRQPALLHGKSLRTVFPETPASILYKELHRALREAAPVHFEDRAGAAQRWYEFDAYPNAQGLNLFVRDITARKMADAERLSIAGALELEHLKLESVLRELPVGVIIVSPGMQVDLINPAAGDLFDATVEAGDDLTQKKRGQFETLHGVALDQGSGPLRHTLETGERVVSQEVIYRRSDGGAVTLIVNTLPLTGSTGTVTGALGTYLDVTSLRRTQQALMASEARLQRLFESPVIGFVSGDEETVLEANDCWLKMLGHTNDAVKRGEVRWREMTPPEYYDSDLRARRQLAERGYCEPVEMELIAKDGRRVPVLSGAVSYGGPHESQWIAWVLDLSDRRKLENRLREAGKLESIGLLAGCIAHDFNNILTSVLGNTSLAFESLPQGHPTRGILENAIRSTERAADLTRQLLAYAGRGQVFIRPVDVSLLARETGQLIRCSIPRNVELELELADGLPPVEGDMMQLQQLIMNLVINGAEAVGENTGMVRVITEAVPVDGAWLQAWEMDPDLPPGVYVSLEVHDNGCGMSPETRLHIFDPFFTTKFSGRGLGLAAATGIVRDHKGVMKVRSLPGHGSVFHVLLPALEMPGRPAEEHFLSDSESEAGPVAALLQGDDTILVVDDEAIVRDVAKSSLERYGYTVLVAADGREALSLYRGLSHSISMIVLDMTMPRMSGEETLENLMAINPAARVLLTSGFDESETVGRFRDKGLNGFLRKPFTPAVLAGKVRDVLHAR